MGKVSEKKPRIPISKRKVPDFPSCNSDQKQELQFATPIKPVKLAQSEDVSTENIVHKKEAEKSDLKSEKLIHVNMGGTPKAAPKRTTRPSLQELATSGVKNGLQKIN